MNTYKKRYDIALEKAKLVDRMNIPDSKKEEIYRRLAEWIEDLEKDIEDLPFPFGKKPVKI